MPAASDLSFHINGLTIQPGEQVLTRLVISKLPSGTVMVAVTIGSLLASIALTGFLAYVIGQAVLGRKVGIGETWDGTKRRLPAIAGAVAVTFVGAVLLVAVVFGLPLAWLVAVAALAVLAPSARSD